MVQAVRPEALPLGMSYAFKGKFGSHWLSVAQ
ncbi:hypothetical protein COLO4_13702 [Corchorus olitorius]|uniref:Uncharacterized protein n=1 Tax=Corchorus olitorius TaxID=93759 RepID=A0A1R3JV72_9ROSI|nr:hypothetical protein COLO4_13702 [Corchorus olitorius]